MFCTSYSQRPNTYCRLTTLWHRFLPRSLNSVAQMPRVRRRQGSTQRFRSRFPGKTRIRKKRWRRSEKRGQHRKTWKTKQMEERKAASRRARLFLSCVQSIYRAHMHQADPSGHEDSRDQKVSTASNPDAQRRSHETVMKQSEATRLQRNLRTSAESAIHRGSSAPRSRPLWSPTQCHRCRSTHRMKTAPAPTL